MWKNLIRQRRQDKRRLQKLLSKLQRAKALAELDTIMQLDSWNKRQIQASKLLAKAA